MRSTAYILIWLLDFVLKDTVGILIAGILWLPFHLFRGDHFTTAWLIAGLIVGACIQGLYEGCDLFLMGWAKSIAAKK